MKQLSGVDNLFLALERGNPCMHVGALGIYDPSTTADGMVRFKDILKFFSGRLGKSKVFRRRLVKVPLGLDRPYWVDDHRLDLEYHIRHIALPQPGDWRQLRIQVARLHSRPLDMKRPLWEIYVIEGLDNVAGVPKGSFALYCKFHNSVIDGQAGVALMRAIHSLSPDLATGVEAQKTVFLERDPTSLELYARAVGNRARQVADTSKVLFGVGRSALRLGGAYIKERTSRRDQPAGMARLLPQKVPVTRFDGPVSSHRVFEVQGFSQAGIDRIREHFGGLTGEDVFLAIIAGALRRYLKARNELPDAALAALMPRMENLRLEGDVADLDNQLAGHVVALPTQLADAASRLVLLRQAISHSRKIADLVGADLGHRLIQVLPQAAARRMVKTALLPRINLVASYVDGPQEPLYIAGAKMALFVPINFVMAGVGLNVTGFNYNGMLWIGAVSCRKMMPDPEFFSECLRVSHDELVMLAGDVAASLTGGSELAIPAPEKAARERRSPRQSEAGRRVVSRRKVDTRRASN